MQEKIHTFDNGIRIADVCIMPAQRQRYRLRNVHEADEEDIFTALIKALPDEGSYVNVGCAIGYYAMLAKKLKPGLTVHAIEPLADFRQDFKHNLSLNGFSEDDFKLYAIGVAGGEGRVSFIEKGFESRVLPDPESQTCFQRYNFKLKEFVKVLLGFAGIKRYAAGLGRKTVIDTVSLDTLMGRLGSPVDLLSMDVQGLELEILQGANETLAGGKVKTFIIGTHGKQLHKRCIAQFMRNGYDIEFENADTQHQPDGIIVASKGTNRLKGQV